MLSLQERIRDLTMKDYKQLKEYTKNKYDVDRVYSYSQVKTFEDDPYEYYLKYVVYQKPDIETQSVYGVLGGIVHDILEKFYKNEIKREDCQKEFESAFKEALDFMRAQIKEQPSEEMSAEKAGE